MEAGADGMVCPGMIGRSLRFGLTSGYHRSAGKCCGCVAAVEVLIVEKRSTGIKRSNQRIPRRFEYAQERFPLLPVLLIFLDLVGSPHSRIASESAPLSLAHQTLRFSAEVLPRLATSSYSTVCPSLSEERPVFST